MRVAIVFDLIQVTSDPDIFPDALTENHVRLEVHAAIAHSMDELNDSLFDVNGWEFNGYEVRILDE